MFILVPGEEKESVPPKLVAVRGRPMKGSRRVSKGIRRGGMALPPEINLTPTLSHVYRFICATTTSATIQAIQLFGALGGICSATNSVVSTWASSARIRKVVVWPSPSSSAGDSPFIDWFFSDTSLFPDESRSVSLPEGVTVTEPLTFVPPRNSLCGMWVNSTATSTFSLFNLSITAGTIVDLHVDLTLGLTNSTSSSLYQLTVATGALGNVYYLALDGPGNNKITPVPGVPTTH